MTSWRRPLVDRSCLQKIEAIGPNRLLGLAGHAPSITIEPQDSVEAQSDYRIDLERAARGKVTGG